MAMDVAFVDTFFPEKSIQKPRSPKNSLLPSSIYFIPGMLSRLFVFHRPHFSAEIRKKEAENRSNNLGLLNFLFEMES